MPSLAIFTTLYKQLNRAQKEAVDAIEGPVMVVAGPGTGKTQILTLRIANILRKTDTAPENILALTFTESGVASMRRRLLEIIGSPAYSVVINTFHGFCNDIIKTYPEDFPRIIGSTNITEADQIQIIERLIEKLPLKELKPFGDMLHYARDIANAINDLKREGVDPAKFEKIIEHERAAFEKRTDLYHTKGAHTGAMQGRHQKTLRQIKKNEELVRIYEAYEKTLTNNRHYDYTDMIVEVLREISRNKNLLLMLQEQHQYILADEHQDTNNAQNRIVELLASFHSNPNIFVVGDEKQAIFRFQGASLENFLYFKKLYPQAKLIVLEENYRSTQAILDSAESVLPGEKRLRAASGHSSSADGKERGKKKTQAGEKIRLYAFSRVEVEVSFIAQDVNEKITLGIPPRDIAVLYRDNKDVLPLAAEFERVGISFSIESDQDVLADSDVQKLLLLLRAVEEFGSDEILVEAMHIDFLRIHPLDLYTIIAHAAKSRQSLFDIVKSKRSLDGLGLEAKDAVSDFYAKLILWRTLSKNRSLVEFFATLVRESGFLAHLLARPDATEKLEKLNGLFDEIKKLLEKRGDCTLKDFLEYLDTLVNHNLLVKKSGGTTVSDAVRLMTAHRAKGQEFGHVYIANAFDGHWGNRRVPKKLELPEQVYLPGADIVSSPSTISSVLPARDTVTPSTEWPNAKEHYRHGDDERRLFYVALTRAKKSLTITYATRNSSGAEQLPSQFVEEIKQQLIEKPDTTAYEAEFQSHGERNFALRVPRRPSLKDKLFITDLFHARGLSVTALNTYLECPWKYFYLHLLRVPVAETKHQLYGTAVHRALKDFFAVREKKSASKQHLLNLFVRHLHKQPFAESDRKESEAKGKRALSGWFDTHHGTWPAPAVTELRVGGIVIKPNIRLTGMIDRLEFTGTKNDVNVVDYKTSKPKSRNEIEGKTKNSNGNEKRQLVFYKLLLDKFHDGKKYRMISGDIDFIEPDSAGRYKKERFEIGNDDVKALEGRIQQTAEEITSLAFSEIRCDDKECEFCALREMMA